MKRTKERERERVRGLTAMAVVGCEARARGRESFSSALIRSDRDDVADLTAHGDRSYIHFIKDKRKRSLILIVKGELIKTLKGMIMISPSMVSTPNRSSDSLGLLSLSY